MRFSKAIRFFYFALMIPIGMNLASIRALAEVSELTAETKHWRQWGGPNRDFAVASAKLSSSWEVMKPREVFRRELGGGHSAIVAADGCLYVQHGRKKTERMLAIRFDGTTIWEKEHEVGYSSSVAQHDGPHATPLIWNELIISVSIDATIRARNLATGALVWQRDLRKDHGLVPPQAGYAASPLLVGDTLLLPGLGGASPDYTRVDKEGLGILALDAQHGLTRWAKHSFPSSHASPVLIRLGARSIALFHGMLELIAIESESGNLLWRFPIRDGAADNVSFTPLWDEAKRVVFLSHAYDSLGMQAIQLFENGDNPRRIWSNRRLKVEHGNAMLFDDVLIASHLGSPGFLVGLDAQTGKMLWKERLPKATLLRVNDLGLFLDESGKLHVARPNREGSNIASSNSLLSEKAWTAPSIVGKTLFLRDPFVLLAVQLP